MKSKDTKDHEGTIRLRSQPQPFCYEVLHALRNHQRLWDAAQSREGKLLDAPGDYAVGEVDVDFVAGDDRLLFCRDFLRERLTDLLHQTRNLDAKEAIVVCIAKVGLREAGSDHQRDTLRFQAGDRLLSAGAGAEVEAADDHVAGLR